MMNDPRFSSTDSPVMRGIWKSSMGVLIPWWVSRRRTGTESAGVCAPGGRAGWVGPVQPLPARVLLLLLGVQLDDQLLLHGRRDLTTLRLAEHLRRQAVVVGLQPRRDLSGELGRVADDGLGAGPDLDGQDVALTDLIAGDVHAAAVDGPVAVTDHLPGLAARSGEAQAHDDVVQARLQEHQQVLTRDALLAGRLVVVAAELAFENAVVAASLLLLAELHAVLRLLLAATTVVARRVRAALDAALVGQAALALQEELLPFAAALLALRTGVTSHAKFLDAAPLAGAAAVVGLRGNVLDARHLEAGGLERADRGLAAGAGTLHEDLDLLKALLDALAGSGVGRDLRGERRRLAGALEAGAAGGLPRDDVAFAVGEGDDRVVERSLDVGLADGDVLLRLAAAPPRALACGHYLFPAFFLPVTDMPFSPLRVRALVLVFCPRTGRPRRWRRPR